MFNTSDKKLFLTLLADCTLDLDSVRHYGGAPADRPARWQQQRPTPRPPVSTPENSVRARQLVQDFDRRRPTGDSLKQQVTTGNGREAVFTGEGRGRLAVERPQEGRGARVGGVGSIAMAFRGSGVAYREHPRRTSVDHTPCQGI